MSAPRLCNVNKIAAVLTVTLTGLLLTGCAAQGPSEDDYKSACEAKVSAGVTHWWEDQYGESPWDVVDAKSISVKRGTEAETAYYVSGSATVRPDHRNTTTEPIRWSCFAQPSDGNVSAAIRSVSAQ